MTRELDDLSDAELIERAREGDSPAYGVLWKRHWNAGRAMAASVTGRFEPDDLASEAFARILKSIEKGSGPRSGFRSYLATTVRNVAIDWSRRKATPNIEDPDIVEDWTYSELTALERMDRQTVADAFYALPDSWQEVLWYTVVEDMPPREVAPLLGLTPNAVSALSARAREGLRQAWISAHLADGDGTDPAHTWTITKLGSYVRGRLSRADHRRVVAHLDECEPCTNAASEADYVGSRLALGLLPLFLGFSGAAAYTAWTAHHHSSGAVAATLAPNLPPGGAGRLRHLLQSAASGPSLGVTTVAASLITAVALTAAVAGTAGPDLPSASAENRSTPSTGARDGKSAGGTAQDLVAAAPGVGAEGARTAGGGPDRSAPPSSPADSSPPGLTPPGTPPDPSPEGPSTVDPPAVEPPTVEPPTVEPPTVEPPTVEPPTVEPPTVEPPTVEPPIVEPPTSPAGCEAAVRVASAEDTLFSYRLDDADDATTAVDVIHGATARYDRPRTTPGWSLSDGVLRPATDVFTIQVWFRTDSGGGRLLGFSSDVQGTSWAYDRHLFLTDDGRVVFGVFPDAVHTVSSSASYADGSWHQATASLSADGMALYVDGELVAADSTVVRGHDFAGYWRVGTDNLNNWGPDTPTTRAFAGTLAFATVYRTPLTAEQVQAQWKLCR